MSEPFLKELPPRSSRITAPFQSHSFCTWCLRGLFLTRCVHFLRNLVYFQQLHLSTGMADLCCTDALLTISHHLQRALDVGHESYIVLLGSRTTLQHSAGFVTVASSIIWSLFVSVVEYWRSVMNQLLINRRQRVLVDGEARVNTCGFWSTQRKCIGPSSVHSLYQWCLIC